jgi:endonuclease YncB( thermonuclease family)
MLEYILNNSKNLKLIHVGRCKYFRILADIEADGVAVSDILLKMGLAVSFMTE